MNYKKEENYLTILAVRSITGQINMCFSYLS